MASFNLQDAYLCLDCETVHNNPYQCVKCCSKAIHSLALFLDRRAVGEAHDALFLPIGVMPDVEDGRG